MRRREFLGLLGAAVACPLNAYAQNALPQVGILSGATASAWAPLVAALHRGMGEAGFIDGRNMRIEQRWAEGQYDRLPAMASELLSRNVSVIAAFTTPAALAAKAATATVPIVFSIIGDPVQTGLVASLGRPGGNLTGATYLGTEIAAKLLELLHEITPSAATMALLVNPANPNVEAVKASMQAAARRLGLELRILHGHTEEAIEAAFVDLRQHQAGGLVIAGDPFMNARLVKLAALAISYRVPTVYQARAFAEAGGLFSYGGSADEAYRVAGLYIGRILKGERPSDLPVQQSTKIELVINLKAASALGLALPQTLLARADDVIE